jgi:glycosyltransferase involved in cell wall biosynthesis
VALDVAVDLISVVMPAWNSEATIADAIRSVLSQTWTALELLVVDDGSTDGTSDQIRAFAAADARVRPLWLEHGGGPRAMNAALQAARGRYVARLDADDVAVPGRLERQWARLQQADIDLCGAQVALIGEQSGQVWFPEGHEAIGRELVFRVGVLHSTLMAPLALLRDEGYDEDVAHDDYEIQTRLYGRYRMANLPDVLVSHRVHARQSSRVDRDRFARERRRYRFRFVYQMFPRLDPRRYAVLATLAEGAGFSRHEDLMHAGQWLVTLAEVPDRRLRERMARRWDDACAVARFGGLTPTPEWGDLRAAILGRRQDAP